MDKNLDRAVLDAYGWPHPSTCSGQALSDEEILARLLALNLERAAGQPSTSSGGAGGAAAVDAGAED